MTLSPDELDETRMQHCSFELQRSGCSWAHVRAAFLALDPPYIGRDYSQRWKATPRQRREMYERQAGRCAYCGCELLALDAYSIAQAHRQELKRAGDIGWWADPSLWRDNLPQLDHRRPVSRGGTHTADNLCLACRRCNQKKGVRTVEEFLSMPDDPISRVGMYTVEVAWMIAHEDRYDWHAQALQEHTHDA